MTARYLSEIWTTVAPALGDHLWQSTVFAALAGLLTLALRNNHARARYGLWLAASLKFLIPFSLLVGLGSHFAWTQATAGTSADLYSAVQGISQPFAPTGSMTVGIQPAPPAILPSLIHLLPSLLGLLWLAGFVIVMVLWCRRWRRISAALRRAAPLTEGREAQALLRIERRAGIEKKIEIVLSRAAMEPGIFGIVRPVLVWPERISERLDDAQLEAILAHEVWHVRRHDNLAAAVHMVVEAVFWFYPLVWWLGGRLIEERERACDEEVLQMGNPANVYAESILKTCEFCVESPLACASGVTGADLKKRIMWIMAEGVVRKLDLSRKALLGAAGVLAFAAPIVLGLATTHPRVVAPLLHANGALVQPFEAVSIRPSKPDPDDHRTQLLIYPDKFSTHSETINEIIRFAYNIKSDRQLSGGPSWVGSDKYDIEAKEDEATAKQLKTLPMREHNNQIRLMVQTILADRFKLKVSHAAKELPLYALVVAKDGPKMEEKPSVPASGIAAPPFIQYTRPGQLTGTNIGVGLLADVLSRQPELGRLVVDETGLKGNYNWILRWKPEQIDTVFRAANGTLLPHVPPPDISGPSIFAALEEQLGLKLEARKAPVETLVIKSIEKPSEN